MEKILTLKEWRDSDKGYDFGANWNLLQSSFYFNKNQYLEDISEAYARYVLYHPMNALSEVEVVDYVKNQMKDQIWK